MLSCKQRIKINLAFSVWKIQNEIRQQTFAFADTPKSERQAFNRGMNLWDIKFPFLHSSRPLTQQTKSQSLKFHRKYHWPQACDTKHFFRSERTKKNEQKIDSDKKKVAFRDKERKNISESFCYFIIQIIFKVPRLQFTCKNFSLFLRFFSLFALTLRSCFKFVCRCNRMMEFGDNKIISKCMFIISVHEKCIFE